ncbi:MAG: type II toxin-antitoxin system RelE/ParE family toxin [bacterium]
MEAVPQTLLEYVTEDGVNPFREWLEDIDDVVFRARIRVRLNRLRLGNLGDSKSVGGGVFEIRMTMGSGFRIYFGKVQSDVVLLLCGGNKSSRHRDIKKAKEFLQDYKRRIS